MSSFLSHTHTLTHLLSQFTVLIDVSRLLAAEVRGGLSTGAAEDWNLGIAAVVVAVAGGGLALVHGVVLGGPLQRREALDVPGENPTETTNEPEEKRRKRDRRGSPFLQQMRDRCPKSKIHIITWFKHVI